MKMWRHEKNHTTYEAEFYIQMPSYDVKMIKQAKGLGNAQKKDFERQNVGEYNLSLFSGHYLWGGRHLPPGGSKICGDGGGDRRGKKESALISGAGSLTPPPAAPRPGPEAAGFREQTPTRSNQTSPVIDHLFLFFRADRSLSVVVNPKCTFLRFPRCVLLSLLSLYMFCSSRKRNELQRAEAVQKWIGRCRSDLPGRHEGELAPVVDHPPSALWGPKRKKAVAVDGLRLGPCSRFHVADGNGSVIGRALVGER